MASRESDHIILPGHQVGGLRGVQEEHGAANRQPCLGGKKGKRSPAE
jgi:hypothetical protein